VKFLIWLAVGSLVGLFGSVLVRTDSQEGLIRNVAIGIAGAVVGNWLFGLVSEAGSSGVSVGGILASVAGAIAAFALARQLGRS